MEPNFTIVQIGDYSVRANGRYLGYVNREIRGIYRSSTDSSGRYQVEGTWYHSSEIKKEGLYQALPIDRVDRNRFVQDILGNMSGFQGRGGPQFRNFPVFPAQEVSPGDRWEAPMSMIISDSSSGLQAEIPLYCGYQFTGEGTYQERDVYFVEAQFALRYRKGSSAEADQFLNQLSGTHKVVLTIDKETMAPIVLRDNFQEQWQFQGGNTRELRGFNLVFYDGVSLLNRGEVVDDLTRSLGDDIRVIHRNEEERRQDEQDRHQENDSSTDMQQQMENFTRDFQETDITLYEREDGLTLSLNNLHFIPDQAVILPEDRPLLDRIAHSLLAIPEKSFLVTGHTADVGTLESQILLSLERARVVVDELVERGISADRFLYLGMGGSEPLADNSSEEGMAVNRRVEITILED